MSEVSINPLDAGAQINNPNFDNAPIINSIINSLPAAGGRILLPAGELWINSPILVNRSYVTIKGVNAGTRSNIDPEERSGILHPGGGSKIILKDGCTAGIFSPQRTAVRLSAVILEDFLIQGRGSDKGQTGIQIEHDNDAVRILGVSTINLNTGIHIKGADAAIISGCWISESRNSIQAVGSSQQLLIANNHMGAQPEGRTLYLENPSWANVTGNSIYPAGYTCLETTGANDCSFTGNNIQSYYTGAVIINGNGNLFSGRIQALQSSGSWLPDPIGRDGLFGLLHIQGNDNHITAATINSAQPATHTRVLIRSGNGNWVTNTKIYGIESSRKIVINGSTVNTRIVHSAPATDVDKGGSNAVVVW